MRLSFRRAILLGPLVAASMVLSPTAQVANASCGATAGSYWDHFTSVSGSGCNNVGTRAKKLDIQYYWTSWSYSPNDYHVKDWIQTVYGQMNCGNCP